MNNLASYFPPLSNVIRPLNLEPEIYAAICNSPPPRHLELGFQMLVPEGTTYEDMAALLIRLKTVSQLIEELFHYEGFRQEFLPPQVEKLTIGAGYAFVDQVFWAQFSDTQFQWTTDGVVIQVVLADAERHPFGERIVDFVMAVAYLDQWAVETGTTDPAAHQPKPVDAEDAQQYDEFIGDLFLSGQAVWPALLMPFRHAVMVGARAALEKQPLIPAMREFMQSGRSFYWETMPGHD